MNDATHTLSARRLQADIRAVRAALAALDRNRDPWPMVREARRNYFRLLHRLAVAEHERRWAIPAQKSDDVHAIDRCEDIMIAARKCCAALLADENSNLVELIDAEIAEEIAESNYEIAVWKNREAYGGPERDAAQYQRMLDTTLPPLLEE